MTAVAAHAEPTVPMTARSLNVLHTVRSLRVNGITNVVLRTIGALDPTSVRSHVCSVYDDDHLAFVLRDAGIDPVFARHTGAHTAARTVVRIARLIRERDIDVVHANQVIDGVLAGAAARLCGVPVVLSLHWTADPDTTVPADAAARSRRAVRHVVRVASDQLLADRIVAVSEAVADTHAAVLGRGFPRGKVEVVYPGLDFAQDTPIDGTALERLRSELGLARGAPVILNIGRLDPVKGQKHLVPMMEIVARERPDATLLIAGDGQLRDELAAQIAERSLGGRIRLLGWRLDVDALLSLANVLVISSATEAAPLPVLEAARRRTPVVAPRVGGIPELLHDGVNGYTVPPADPAAMADAVLRILRDPAAGERMGDAGHRMARERFGLDESARRLTRIYASLAHAGHK